VLSASIALDSALNCSIALEGPHSSSKSEQSVTLHGGQQKVIYIIPPRLSKIPKLVKVLLLLLLLLLLLTPTRPATL
jgi:hypothetical protein